MTAVADLFPGYFAMVMATGIVSIAAFLLGMQTIAWALVYINIVSYALLAAMTLVRVMGFFPRVAADIVDNARGPGFFTLVAGTCVLGSQLLIVAGLNQIAYALWIVGLALWVTVMYSFFAAMTVKENSPRSTRVSTAPG